MHSIWLWCSLILFLGLPPHLASAVASEEKDAWGNANQRAELVAPLPFERGRSLENEGTLGKTKGEGGGIDPGGDPVKGTSDRNASKGERKGLKHPLFKLVEDLIDQRPFTPTGVARLTGALLQRDSGPSNPYFAIWQSVGDTQRGLSGVELRVPTAMSDKRDGLLILSVSPFPCISSEDVWGHFGQEPELRVQPPELGGFTYEYQFPWGALRFAFGSGKPSCLKVIVIDAILPKSPEEE